MDVHEPGFPPVVSWSRGYQLPEPTVQGSFPNSVCRVILLGSLKPAVRGVFPPGQLANTTKQAWSLF